MNFSTLLVIFLQSGVVLATALVAGLLTRRTPALRLAIGRVALLCVAGLVVATPWLGQRRAPIVPVVWNSAPVAQYTTSAPTQSVTNKPAETQAPAAVVSTPQESQISISPMAIWAIGIVFFAAYLGLGYFSLWRIRRACTPVDDPRVTEALKDAARAAGIWTPRAVTGQVVGNPFVAGVMRPTVFLPENEFDDESLRAVLRHEVAHIANGDLRWGLLHRIACVALWPQPFLWLLRRPMEAASEELCDRHVLASGIPDVQYAECLLALRESARTRPCPSLGIGAVSRISALARRVESILDARRSRSVTVSRPVSMLTRLGALGVAAVAAFVFARPDAGNSMQDDGWITKPYSGTVRLIGPNGQPVKDATAWLVLSGDVPALRYIPLKVEGGRIDFVPKDIPPRTAGALFVRAKGLGPGFVRMWPARALITQLQLPAATTLKGRIKLSGGGSSAGIKVVPTVFLKVPFSPTEGSFVTLSKEMGQTFAGVTDSNGNFELKDMPSGVSVGLDVDDERLGPPSYEDRIEISASGTAEFKEIVLDPAATFTGVVTRGGKPVAGIKVAAQENHDVDRSANGWGEAVTDAQGRYTMTRLRACVYNVSLDLRGGLDAEVTAVAHEAVAVKAGQTVSGLDFDLIPGAVIRGRVVGEDGQPLPETYVGVYGPAHPSSSAWVQGALTNANGEYWFRVPPGKQRVYVSDGRYNGASHEITVADSTTTVLDLHTELSHEMADRARAEPERTEITHEKPKPDEDGLPTPPVMSFGPGKPFYGPAKLHNGATVRLSYVQDDAAASHSLWKPDGSPAEPTDVAASLNMKGFRGRGPDPVRRMFLRVDVDGVPRADYHCILQVPHKSSWTVWQTYGDDAHKTMDLASFRAARTIKVTDMRFGVAAGPYQVAQRGRPGEAPLNAKLGDGGDAHLQDAVDGGVTITVRFPAALEGKDVRLAAYDHAGKALDLAVWQGTVNGTRTFGFRGATEEDIDHVELLVRDYEWVTFRGINLYPK